MATVAVLATAVQVGLIPATERLLLLFLLMQGATPSAMFLGVMSQMHQDTEREAIMSQLLFVLNIAAIPLFTVSQEAAACRTQPCLRCDGCSSRADNTSIRIIVRAGNTSDCACLCLSVLPDSSVVVSCNIGSAKRHYIPAGVILQVLVGLSV